MAKKVAMILVAVLVPLVLLLSGVEIAVKDDGFFQQQYVKNDVMENTGMELETLMEVTDVIQDYLFGHRDDLVYSAIIDGVEREVFNEREIVHMKDVEVLFHKGMVYRNMAALFLLAAVLYGMIRKKTFVWKGLLYGCILLLVGGVLVGTLLYLDFDRYFVMFHEVFFSNDYWILDPDESVLINMVPLPFFISMVQRIVLWTVAGTALTGLVGILGLKREARHG